MDLRSLEAVSAQEVVPAVPVQIHVHRLLERRAGLDAVKVEDVGVALRPPHAVAARLQPVARGDLHKVRVGAANRGAAPRDTRVKRVRQAVGDRDRRAFAAGDGGQDCPGIEPAVQRQAGLAARVPATLHCAATAESKLLRRRPAIDSPVRALDVVPPPPGALPREQAHLAVPSERHPGGASSSPSIQEPSSTRLPTPRNRATRRAGTRAAQPGSARKAELDVAHARQPSTIVQWMERIPGRSTMT